MKALGKRLLNWFVPRYTMVYGRLRLWGTLWVLSNMLVFTILIQTGAGMALSRLVGDWVPIALIAIQIAGILAFWWWTFRMRRRAGDLGWKMCNRCGYDLRSTAEPGPCPECGSEFTYRGLEDYWTRTWNV